jgi:hypothetical protein
MGYIFGLILLNLIDDRLNKINNNNTNLNIEKFNNNNNNTEIADIKTYNFNDDEKIIKKNSKDYNFDENYYNQMNKDSIIGGYGDKHNPFKEWNIEKKKTQICIKNHPHTKAGNDLNCTYGVTNYADPSDMSPIDYKVFNLNYPPNLTLQDYINWLFCFIDKENDLPYNHLKNLEKLKANISLVEEEGILPPPSYYYPPKDAKDYFDKMYNDINEFNIAGPLNSVTGPMLGYNCDEYSEFSQNLDTNGSSGKIRNKEDISKKKNAKELYNYINPKDSNNLEIEKENEIYHIKNVEV